MEVEGGMEKKVGDIGVVLVTEPVEELINEDEVDGEADDGTEEEEEVFVVEVELIDCGLV